MASSGTCRIVRATLIASGVLASGCAWAQDGAKRVLESARRGNPSLEFKIEGSTGLPSKIRGLAAPGTIGPSLGASRLPSPNEARAAAEAFFNTGALAAAFETKGARSTYKSIKVRRDPDVAGQHVVQMEQRVNDVPVFGSSAKVVVNPSLSVTQLTANLSPVEVASMTPQVDEAKAIGEARDELKFQLEQKKSDRIAQALLRRIETLPARAQLIVFDPGLLRKRAATEPGKARLSYIVSIDSFRVFIDAISGQAIYFYRDQPWVLQRRIFDLAASTRFPGTKSVDEATGERVDPLSTDAGLAFQNSAHVHAFFEQLFGRKGIKDENGPATLESYVRYGDVKGAFWCKAAAFECPRPGVMVYGPHYVESVDVVGHEMTHGVIIEEADLVYADEPGAVNEALADIFGTLIEFHTRQGNGNWVIGEALPGMSLTSPLRSLAHPNLMDADGNSMFQRDKPFDPATNRGQPDHYDQYVHRGDALCEPTTDFYVGCVHFNSGILNKFAFLIAEGGIHRGVSVKGIGRDKLGRVAYRALTTQLTASSTLEQAAEGFNQACLDYAASELMGFTQDDCQSIRRAKEATGLVTPTG